MSLISWKVNYNDLMKSSLKCVSKSSINNVSTFVQVMAWWRISAKLLPESLMTTIHLDAIWLHYRIGHCNQWWLILLTHICVTRPQWVKSNGNWNFAILNKSIFLFSPHMGEYRNKLNISILKHKIALLWQKLRILPWQNMLSNTGKFR